MTTNTEDEVMRHGTMMCGDPKFWFPMRVTYVRERKVISMLKSSNEVLKPLRYMIIRNCRI